MSKGLFVFTAHDSRCLASLLRLVQSSGGPYGGGTGRSPPKMHTEDSEHLSQLLGDS